MQKTLNLQLKSFEYHQTIQNDLNIYNTYYKNVRKTSEIKEEESEWIIAEHFLGVMYWAYHFIYKEFRR